MLGSTYVVPFSKNLFYWLENIIPLFVAFWLGAVAMRGAGCTYNDIVDVDIDEKVARTASRPIPSGRVSKIQAAVFLCIQALVGFGCLLFLSTFWSGQSLFPFAFWLGIGSLLIVALYPFAKRVTDWPQLVLGLAFSWGGLMGWAAIVQALHIPAFLLYVAAILWTIGYDTIYAHQDREDDALVGVRSTARLFGDKTKTALFILYGGTILFLGAAILCAHVGDGIMYIANPGPDAYQFRSELVLVYVLSAWPSYLGLIIGSGHMMWQIQSLDINDGDKCLKLFQSNKHFGWIVFAGLFADIIIPGA